jgi:hypothetical protein
MNTPERAAWLEQRRTGIGGQMDRAAWLAGSRRRSIDIERLRALYESGMCQSEVAQTLGCSQKDVCLLMKRHGIAARRAIKRDQRGSANSTWAGNAVCYKAAHNRVYSARGRPQHCEHCGTTDPKKRFEWANKTGQYHDPGDYMRLCRSCHCKHDGLVKNLGAFAKEPRNGN